MDDIHPYGFDDCLLLAVDPKLLFDIAVVKVDC